MRIRDDRLDADDSYSSPWAGGSAGGPIETIGDGRIVVGIYGGVGDQLDRFGLMLDTASKASPASMPEPDMPVARPLASRPILPSTAKNRLPVPPAEAQKEAQALIHGLFKDDYAETSKGPQQRMALAVKLFHKAEETNDDPTARYVLICEARDLAARCGDSLAIADAILLLANLYDIDDVGMTLNSFEKAAEATSAPLPYRRKLIDNCLTLVDRAVSQEKYEVAEQLLAIARRASSKAQDAILNQRIVWRAAKLRDQKAAYDEAREPIEVLKAQPDDAQAMSAVGRYRCFYQDDWRDGLALLAKGSDAPLRNVAQLELADQGSADDQLKVAEAWDALAKTDEKLHALAERRAKHWYTRALPGLRGINKARVEKRLDELLAGRGLKAEYFRGEALAAKEKSITRIDPQVDFRWGKVAPTADLGSQNFSVRWTGLLVGPGKGEYQLTVDHDDGVRIWIDGKPVLDKWNGQGTDHVMVPLAGKPRGIKVEYRQGNGDAHLVLKWAQKGGFAEQVIPPEAFWQDHGSGTKAFVPLPNAPYPATITQLPGRANPPVEPDEP
jgi:hypothetical protein